MRTRWFREDWYGRGAGITFRVTKKLLSRKTPFQKIDVYETASFGRLAAFDGCVMLTDKCHHFYHEMLAHPVLSTRWAATRVCIIGGGDCGVLRESLKHRHVVRIEQVELDPAVTEVAKAYFPHLTERNHDARVSLHTGDGIRWMKEAAPDQCDVIIVDSTDPVGPAEGLFAVDFYRDCFAALRIGGSIATQSGSPILHQDHIRAVRKHLTEAGFTDVVTLSFPQPDYPSGTWSVTVGSKEGGPLRPVSAAFMPPDTKYYSRAVHNGSVLYPSFGF